VLGQQRSGVTAFQADGLQAQVLRPRPTAGGDQDLLAPDLPPVDEGHGDGSTVPADRCCPHASPHRGPATGQRLPQLLAGEGLLPRQQALLGLDHGDPRAQRGIRLGHLDPDRPAAEDQQPPGDRAGGGGFPVRPRVGFGRQLMQAALRLLAAEGTTTVRVATAAADIGNLRFYQRQGFRMRSVERDAFTGPAGYPPGAEVAGIALRDRVWLDLQLGAASSGPHSP
jgi:hypothetical protein